MRTNAKKISRAVKNKKRPAKTTAKRSKQNLLQSAPADTAPAAAETGAGVPRWIIGVAILAAFAAAFAMMVSSVSLRPRAEVQSPAAPPAVADDQSRPVAPVASAAAPVRAETGVPPIVDPEADARYDYMLALTTGTTEAIDLFLARHPDGFHADLARVQRKQLVDFELSSTIRRLNAELKRVGCGPAGNAEWTSASQQALASFNRHAQTKFDVKSPSADALHAVKEQTSRVCPQQAAKAADAEPQKQKRGFFFWQ